MKERLRPCTSPASSKDMRSATRAPSVCAAGTDCSQFFFAGMYSDPRLIEFLSNLAQAELREHPIGHHQVQLNFAPEELSKDVDVWHHDVVAYDFVLLLTDPAQMKGGTPSSSWAPSKRG